MKLELHAKMLTQLYIGSVDHDDSKTEMVTRQVKRAAISQQH